MAFFPRPRKPPPISRDAALACRPVKNSAVQTKRLDTGELLLVYPIRFKPWMTELLRRFKGDAAAEVTRKLQLDELGSSVWSLIDGQRSVRQVADAFAAAYRLHAKEAEMAVTRFLYELGRRGIIAMQSEDRQ
jgi:hypothetical protein